MLRSVITGMIVVAPSSVASRTMASILSPLQLPWSSVTRRVGLRDAGLVASIRAVAPLRLSATISASASIACPGSKARKRSPTPRRWTRVT